MTVEQHGAEGHDAPQYDVLWPLAPKAGKGVSAAARTGEIRSQGIALVWDYVFRGDEIYDVVEHEFSHLYPEVCFVGYERFGNIHGKDERIVVADLPNRLLEHRVDAAIVGVGA